MKDKILNIPHWKKKQKKRRMRILGTCIFLRFLAGKLRHFEQLLLKEFP